MRNSYIENLVKDPQLQYRGIANTRLNTLTDAVFGIALTLLIFNVSDANSFADLLLFAKSFPALLVSIVFLYIIWKEHVSFSVVYGINGFRLQALNVLFIALVIFYVYPLRFLTHLITNLLFGLGMEQAIKGEEIPDLMIFYGSVAVAIYLVLYLCYRSVQQKAKPLALSPYERLHTRAHARRMLIMGLIPFISLSLSFLLKGFSILWASILGGMAYGLYPILIFWWARNFRRQQKVFSQD